MKKIKNVPKKPESEIQILEGVIGKSAEEWQKKLPAGIKPNMADVYLGSDDLYHWHLHPDFIKDYEEREKWRKERNIWP